MQNITTSTRTITTITVDLSSAISEAGINPGDEVEVQFVSAAMNRLPSPVRLSNSTLNRLTRDQ